MIYLISIYLITAGISLSACSGIVQPVHNPISPLLPPAKSVITATPKKQVVLINEAKVVQTEAKGQAISVIVSPRTPTPTPTPVWIDDNLVVVDSSWPNVVELQVGQQMAVMPLIYRRYGWEVKYDTNILERVENLEQNKVPDANWLWTAKEIGETSIKFKSGPPPCHEQPVPCDLSVELIAIIDVKVNP